MQSYGVFYCTFILLMFLSLPAFAFDDNENILINGFVSQGYLKSEHNNFLIPDSTKGSFEFSEVGLTINSRINDQLRLGMQFLSRDLGREGNHEVELDWGYGDFRYNDFFGVRAGKIKSPIGLYNEGIDSDFLRSTVFLPQSVYDETRREISNATTGLGLYGNFNLKKLGYLDYNIVYGEIEIDSESNLNKYVLELINNRFPPAAGRPVDDINFNNDFMFVASLIYTPPLEGFRLGLSYVDIEGVWQAEFNPMIDPVGDLGITDPTISLDFDEYYVCSAEYQSEDITIVAEYFQTERNITAFGIPFDDAVMEDGGYLSVALPMPWHRNLTLTSVYDIYNEDAEGNFDRKDLGFGFRYDFNLNWLLKAEYHDVEGKGRLLSTFFNPQGPVENWSYWTVKTSFNF